MVQLINSNPESELVEKLINFDALDIAEKVTGKDYHDSEETSHLGMTLHMQKNKLKNNLLENNDDTHYGTTSDQFLRIMKDLGFVITYEEPFLGHGWGDDKVINEMFYILWHPIKAILCKAETFGEKSMNTASWYFAYKPNNTELMWSQKFHCSGQFYFSSEDNNSNGIWIGDWDAIEAIRHQMIKFDNFGSFVQPWPKSPNLYLVSYMDKEKYTDLKDNDYSYLQIETERRLKLLPEYIRNCIQGKK